MRRIIKQPVNKNKKKQAKPEIKINQGINLRKEIEEVLAQYGGEIFNIYIWFYKIESGRLETEWINSAVFDRHFDDLSNRHRRSNVEKALKQLDKYYNKNNRLSFHGEFSILKDKKVYKFEFVGELWIGPTINNHGIKLKSISDLTIESDKSSRGHRFQTFKLIKIDNNGI